MSAVRHAPVMVDEPTTQKVLVCAVRPKYLLRDGGRVLAQSTCRSEVMKAAARAPHGAEIGVEGSDPAFTWDCERAAWVYVPKESA